MNVIKSYALFIPLLGALAAWGQAPSTQPIPKVSFSYEKIRNPDARQRDRLIVHVELQPGWHINSEAPLDSFLVPTTVVAKAEGIEFAAPMYPPAVKQHSEVMGGDLACSRAPSISQSLRPNRRR